MAANKKDKKIFLWVCFIAYLLLLGYMLFYSSYFGRVGNEEYRYNLTFLQEIGRFYHLGVNTGNWELFILNVFGNIVVQKDHKMIRNIKWFRAQDLMESQ